jgi:transposase-like protein
MLSFKRMRFPIDVILVCIRWYASFRAASNVFAGVELMNIIP